MPPRRRGCRQYLKIAGFLILLVFLGRIFGGAPPKSSAPSPTAAPVIVTATAQPTRPAVIVTAVPTRPIVATSVVILATNTQIAPTSTPTPAPPTNTANPPTAQPTPLPEPVTYYVTGGQAINVRAEPSTTASVVTRLAPGSEARVVGQVRGDAVGGSDQWYEVETGSGWAYIHSSLLSRTRPVPAAPVQQAIVQPAPQSIAPTSAPSAPSSPFVCNGIDDLNCPDFNRLGMNANGHLALCGDEDNLDGDGDNDACEDW